MTDTLDPGARPPAEPGVAPTAPAGTAETEVPPTTPTGTAETEAPPTTPTDTAATEAPAGTAEPRVAPTPPAGTGGTRRPSASRGGGGNVGAWILASVGAVFLVCAIALAVIHLTQRNADGYYTSDTAAIRSHGYAVTSEGLHFGDLPGFATNAVGQVRVRATSRNGQPLFVGIAPQSAVNGYLGSVSRTVVNEFNGDTVQSTAHAGGAPSGAPGTQGFWEASGSGRGQVNVTWKLKGGNWTVVVMNASARPQVSAGVNLGAKTNLLLWVGLGFFVLAVLAGGAGGAMLWSGRRR